MFRIISLYLQCVTQLLTIVWNGRGRRRRVTARIADKRWFYTVLLKQCSLTLKKNYYQNENTAPAGRLGTDGNDLRRGKEPQAAPGGVLKIMKRRRHSEKTNLCVPIFLPLCDVRRGVPVVAAGCRLIVSASSGKKGRLYWRRKNKCRKKIFFSYTVKNFPQEIENTRHIIQNMSEII